MPGRGLRNFLRGRRSNQNSAPVASSDRINARVRARNRPLGQSSFSSTENSSSNSNSSSTDSEELRTIRERRRDRSLERPRAEQDRVNRAARDRHGDEAEPRAGPSGTHGIPGGEESSSSDSDPDPQREPIFISQLQMVTYRSNGEEFETFSGDIQLRFKDDNTVDVVEGDGVVVATLRRARRTQQGWDVRGTRGWNYCSVDHSIWHIIWVSPA